MQGHPEPAFVGRQVYFRIFIVIQQMLKQVQHDYKVLNPISLPTGARIIAVGFYFNRQTVSYLTKDRYQTDMILKCKNILHMIVSFFYTAKQKENVTVSKLIR